MATAEQPPEPEDEKPWLKPLPPAKHRRLHQCYIVGKTNVEKHENYKYAAQMFAQCVAGDPTNLKYLEALFECLHAQYSNKKKAAGGLASLMAGGARGAVKKAKAKEDWMEVIKAGVGVLSKNPYDAATLVMMADACAEMQAGECELYYLKEALSTNPKDPALNKHAALALERHGDFSQAISCWHRVEEAKPEDAEALEMIGKLTVQRTMSRSEADARAKEAAKARQEAQRKSGAAGKVEEPEEEVELTREQKLLAAIEENPEEESNYLDLANIYAGEDRYEEAEKMVGKALEVSGGGNLKLRERMEDYQIMRYQRQLEIAKRRAAEEKTEEAKQLARRMKAELSRVELEIFARRSERSPGNEALHYEVAVRLKEFGFQERSTTKVNEAIKHFQRARNEANPQPQVHLHLGECFQFIKRYQLAMKDYEKAIDVSDEKELETRKLALYRTGVLAQSLYEKADPPRDKKLLETAEKHLTELAGIDFSYRDVAERLDKIADLRQDD